MVMEPVTLIVPSYNTLGHLKNTYMSVRKYYPSVPLIIIDDASEDGTAEWLRSLDDPHLTRILSDIRRGHTFWYDEGMRLSKTDICGILHSDMTIGPNYIENLLKHLSRGKVVCATRVEPPIHPEGDEKIVKNFGMDFGDYNHSAFESFCVEAQGGRLADVTTRGIFAPWMLYKEDHLRIGGHDQNFAPYGYEDSDIFNRWILAGYEMVQSWDALVYHMTCRGHRWNKGIGIDNPDYKKTMERGQRYFIRKWGQWIQNDHLQYPIIYPRHRAVLIAPLLVLQFVRSVEPYFDTVYIDTKLLDRYLLEESSLSPIDLRGRIREYSQRHTENMSSYDVVVTVPHSSLTPEQASVLINIPYLINEQAKGELGTYEFDGMYITVNSTVDRRANLIHA